MRAHKYFRNPQCVQDLSQDERMVEKFRIRPKAFIDIKWKHHFISLEGKFIYLFFKLIIYQLYPDTI